MAAQTGIAIFLDATKLKAGVEAAKRALTGLGSSASKVVGKMKSGFGGLKATFLNLKTAFAAMVAAFAIKKLLDVNVSFEKMRASLETMTGSVENAEKEFAALQEFAKSTPFTLDQSVQGFIKLSSLGIKPTEENMKSFGNTATAMGKSMNQMIEAVADASTLEFERLKEFGIKARQSQSEVSFTFQGITTTVGRNSEEIVKYLESIGATTFAGAMEKQMSRLPGIISNLQDSFLRLADAIGRGGFTKAFGEMALEVSNFITEIIDSGKAEAIGVLLGDSFRIVAAMIREATAALGYFSNVYMKFRDLGEIAGMWAAGAVSSETLAEAMLALNKAILEGDTGFKAAEKSAGKIGDTLKEVAKDTKKVDETAKKATESIAKTIKEIKAETEALRAQNAFIEQYNGTLFETDAAWNQLIATQEAEKRFASAGLPAIGKQFEELSKRIFENLEAQQRQAEMISKFEDREEMNRSIQETITDLEFEIDRQTDLNAAHKESAEAISAVEAKYAALSTIRQLGIEQYSQEGQVITDLIKQLYKLQDAQEYFDEKDWTAGIRKSVEDYKEAIEHVGRDTYQAMSNAIRGLEDVLTDFFTTGKLSFEDFANSIVADINRILVRQLFIAPILDFIQGGAFNSILGGGGARTTALPAMAGGGIFTGPAIVGEGRMTEAAVPLPDGRRIPVELTGKESTTVNLSMNISTPNAESFAHSERQIASRAGNMIARQLNRSRN